MFDYIHNYFGGWFWPLAIVSLLLFTRAGRKCYIIINGFYHIIVSKDKQFRALNHDPGDIDVSKVIRKQTKTLLLIRHGESTWNEVFNRGINASFPIRLLYTLTRETILFVTSDSCFFDAPLSYIGVTQAENLQKYLINGYLLNNNNNNHHNKSNEAVQNKVITDERKLEEHLKQQPILQGASVHNLKQEEKLEQYISILQGKNESIPSIVISSPLRRCIETVSLGLFQRLNNSKEKIYCLSSLQEMTRNIDGLSLASACEIPPLSWTMRLLEKGYNVNFQEWLVNRLEMNNHDGLKPKERRGDDRLKSFINWLFNTQSLCDTLIVSGHSLWFRTFLKTYLPNKFNYDGKTQKIVNGGVIACEFSKYELNTGVIRYRIEPESCQIIVGGFEPEKKRKVI